MIRWSSQPRTGSSARGGLIVLFENHNVSELLMELLKNDYRYNTSVSKTCTDWVYRNGEGGRILTFKAPVTVLFCPTAIPC